MCIGKVLHFTKQDQCNSNNKQFYFLGIHKKDAFCTPLDVTESHSLDFLLEAKQLFTEWRNSGIAGLTRETFLACLQSLEAMIELSIYLHNGHQFRYLTYIIISHILNY